MGGFGIFCPVDWTVEIFFDGFRVTGKVGEAAP